jgi:hypothetical protein
VAAGGSSKIASTDRISSDHLQIARSNLRVPFRKKFIKIDIAYSADDIWSEDTYEGSQHKHRRLLQFMEADKAIGSFVPCRCRLVGHQIQVPSKRKRIGLQVEVSRFDWYHDKFRSDPRVLQSTRLIPLSSRKFPS